MQKYEVKKEGGGNIESHRQIKKNSYFSTNDLFPFSTKKGGDLVGGGDLI